MYQLSHFSLYGDFDIKAVTASLSLNPSWTLEKGELLDGADSPAQIATWDFNGPDEMGLNEQVNSLIATLWSRAEILKKLTAQFKADLNLVFTCKGGGETLTLKPLTLQKLAELNITLNCFYGADEVEDGN